MFWVFIKNDKEDRYNHFLLQKTSNAKGIVLIAPIRNIVHPSFLPFSGFSISAIKSPAPAPRITRVPAIRAISGIVNSARAIIRNSKYLKTGPPRSEPKISWKT